VLDRDLYAGLSPSSRFFLQDDSSNFDIHFCDKQNTSGAVEPYDMRRHFNKFYLGESVN
jgi:hypothetical protein